MVVGVGEDVVDNGEGHVTKGVSYGGKTTYRASRIYSMFITHNLNMWVCKNQGEFLSGERSDRRDCLRRPSYPCDSQERQKT